MKKQDTLSRLHPANASEKEAKPTDKSTVSEIKAYLDKKGISYSTSTLKNELVALIP